MALFNGDRFASIGTQHKEIQRVIDGLNEEMSPLKKDIALLEHVADSGTENSATAQEVLGRVEALKRTFTSKVNTAVQQVKERETKAVQASAQVEAKAAEVINSYIQQLEKMLDEIS